MFNKLKFNNLVISNKKGIEQSRTQTINKLVHKIRKLKTLLEKHPDNTKCKDRIRKSTETMELLKKLKRMDVIKKVILMDKPASAVITNGIATPEELAIALLSMNKVMQGLIKRFKTELQLNEVENDDWKQVLMESSKRRQKIERTEEKRRKRLELKQQKVMGRKRQEWLEGNQHNIEGENISVDTDCNVPITGAWKIEELPNDVIEKIIDKNENRSNDESSCPIKEKPLAKNTTVTNIKQKTENIKDANNFQNTKFQKKEEYDNNLTTTRGKRSIIDINQNERPNGTTEDCAGSLVADTFFITDTGENYMSTAIIKRDESNGEENISKKDLHMVKLNNNYDKKPVSLKDRRPQIRNENRKYLPQQNTNKWNNEREQHNFLQNKLNDKKTLQMEQQSCKYQKSSYSSDEKNLHPSWQAKQKLKPIITEFQGRKIIFEDDKPKKSTTSKSNKSDDFIHPSWAAKQKLKPSITAFQGKKITFDDDE